MSLTGLADENIQGLKIPHLSLYNWIVENVRLNFMIIHIDFVNNRRLDSSFM
jgi:hypothetical protein